MVFTALCPTWLVCPIRIPFPPCMFSKYLIFSDKILYKALSTFATSQEVSFSQLSIPIAVFIKYFFFIFQLQLIYNIILVSGVQPCD